MATEAKEYADEHAFEHKCDLVQYKNEKSIREAGKLRSEGKDYVMQDGDVVNFLFNV